MALVNERKLMQGICAKSRQTTVVCESFSEPAALLREKIAHGISCVAAVMALGVELLLRAGSAGLRASRTVRRCWDARLTGAGLAVDGSQNDVDGADHRNDISDHTALAHGLQGLQVGEVGVAHMHPVRLGGSI